MWRAIGLFSLFVIFTGVVIGLGERFFGDMAMVDVTAGVLSLSSAFYAFKVTERFMPVHHFRNANRRIDQYDNEKNSTAKTE